MKLEGRAWIFDEDDINTDVIYPGKYTYELLQPDEMASHAMEDYDPSFSSKVAEGDIIIAGRNFGCGSSREQAVTCLKYSGITAVIASSFARLFYRNAINQALYVIVCPEACDHARANSGTLDMETVVLDPEGGRVTIADKEFTFIPMQGKALEIFEAGGLAPYTRRKLEEGSSR